MIIYRFDIVKVVSIFFFFWQERHILLRRKNKRHIDPGYLPESRTGYAKLERSPNSTFSFCPGTCKNVGCSILMLST